MGNFYTNYTLRGPSQQTVAKVLAGRKAIVTREDRGCVVAFDEESDGQDQEQIGALAGELSRKLQCPVLAVVNHDDDILWYQLYESGRLSDEYDSTPGYFDPATESSTPAGGDARRLAAAFGAVDAAAVERVLRPAILDADGYVFAFQRHAALVRALGLAEYGVGMAYASFERDRNLAGLTSADIVRCD